MRFFPRGSGPLISVIMPTRNRSPYLLAAIDSCVSLAKDVNNLEFILKLDDDDQETIATVQKLKTTLPQIKVREFITPRGNGYFDIWRWDNELAKHATGDWLFLFNDDAVIKTQNWDELIDNLATSSPWAGITDVCLLVAQTIDRPFVQEFIFLRKKTFDILGHFGFSPHLDNWLYSVCYFIRAHISMEMRVQHTSDTIEDKTRKDSVEAYRNTIASLTSIKGKWQQMSDAHKLLLHMTGIAAERRWSKLPDKPGWYFWREHGEAAERSAIVHPTQDAVVFHPDGSATVGQSPEQLGGEWCPIR